MTDLSYNPETTPSGLLPHDGGRARSRERALFVGSVCAPPHDGGRRPASGPDRHRVGCDEHPGGLELVDLVLGVAEFGEYGPVLLAPTAGRADATRRLGEPER